MATGYATMVKKLQNAINLKFDEKLLVNRNQWYSDKEKRPISLFVVRKAVWDEVTKRNTQVELFSTYSNVDLVLWLRDYWFELNGWEIPFNERWEKTKREYKQRREEKNGK